MASREAVTTQVYWVWVPSRSPMIVGSAVETIVVLTMATNSADMRPMRTSTISLWLISPVVPVEACAGRDTVDSDMRFLASVACLACLGRWLEGLLEQVGKLLDHRA